MDYNDDNNNPSGTFMDSLLEAGAITFADYEVYKWIKRLCGSETIALIGFIVNLKLGSGDTYILLDEIENKDIITVLREVLRPNRYARIKENNGYMLPDKNGLLEEFASGGEIVRGLFHVDDKGRIFFKRIYNYEKAVARIFAEMAKSCGLFPSVRLPENITSEIIASETIVPEAPSLTAQERAVKMAGTGRLLIVSGGPGTGKTTAVKTIIKNLAAQKGAEEIRIALAAPTGKAVSRLANALEDLPDNNKGRGGFPIGRAVIDMPVTLHKLIGVNPFNTGALYCEKNRLPYDLVIVDEFSMVSLEMVYRMLVALKDGSRLILLGDKDQLASVEMGAVMNEICYPAGSNPLKGCLIEFDKNYRFKDSSGIGQMSKAIKGGVIFSGTDENAARDFLETPFEDLRITGSGNTEEMLDEIAGIYFKKLDGLAERNYENTLDIVSSVKILTPYNETKYGARMLNEKIDGRLRRKINDAAHADNNMGEWYPGRQVIIRVNDYQNELFNGDIGICKKIGGENKVIFPGISDEGRDASGARTFEPFLLPPYDLAFALTVHKSQGSEFDEVYFFLGENESDILNRELIYTAVTRARKKLTIVGSKDLLIKSLKKRTKRKSVISELLCDAGAFRY